MQPEKNTQKSQEALLEAQRVTREHSPQEIDGEHLALALVSQEESLIPDLLERIMAELKRHFRLEFLNRVDDVIIFQSLDEEELAKIVEIQIERLENRLRQQNLTLSVDAAAKKLLAKEGYDPQFGARPLKRTLQDQLLNPLSMKLLEGEFKLGDKIKVTTKDDGLVFKK
jgi:ATP-dependent Clp protease ATP-binding subunit ClpA